MSDIMEAHTMVNKRFYLIMIMIFIGVLTMAGCNNAQVSPQESPQVTLTAASPSPTPGQPPAIAPWPYANELLARRPVILQLTPLTAGEELVILHTNHGDITLRLFPKAAPVAVENFITHARNGYYDGLIFHRVIEDFMIQGGCSRGDGRGGESIWGTGFGPEHNYDLWHFNGALAMAQTNQANSIGSQFYIVHDSNLDARFTRDFNRLLEGRDDVMWPEDWDGTSPHLKVGDIYLREMLEHYLAVGGRPMLDFPFNPQGPNFGHTVFGHVVEGMDVVNAIAATPVDANDRPLANVIIERASVIVYEG